MTESIIPAVPFYIVLMFVATLQEMHTVCAFVQSPTFVRLDLCSSDLY